MPRIETLGALRHICHASGGCCQGNVASLKAQEQDILRTQAQALDISNPIEEQAIRKQKGQCVFLNEHKLCRIHERFGGVQKPTVCQQFPVVAIHTEEEIRVGIDPGCLSAWKSWETGPIIQPKSLISSKIPLPNRQRTHENKLLRRPKTRNIT